MSTPVGHSRRQPLQPTHRSIVSYMASEVSASAPSCPARASRSVFARPRVRCCSSSVARNEGHITPASRFRQVPLLLHISVAPRNEPQSDQSSRSEEHTSELQSLMRISYAVFCLKKKTITTKVNTDTVI